MADETISATVYIDKRLLEGVSQEQLEAIVSAEFDRQIRGFSFDVKQSPFRVLGPAPVGIMGADHGTPIKSFHVDRHGRRWWK